MRRRDGGTQLRAESDRIGGLGRGFWLRLIGVAFAVRVVVVFGVLHAMPVVSDASAYTEQARRLARHWSTGAYYWPPGQSYALAGVFVVFGDGDNVAKAANIGIDVTAIVLAVLVARRLLVDERAVRLTGWILAVFPSLVLMSGQPYSLSLTMVCLLAVTLLLLRGCETGRLAEFAAAGGILGFAILTRPSTITVIPALSIVAGVLAWRSLEDGHRSQAAGFKSAAAFCAVATAVVSPVVVHNQRHGQGLTVSTANEQNFWLGNNPYTPAYKTWELGSHPVSDFAPPVREYLRGYNPGSPSLAQRHAMLHDALAFIAHHPAITALRTVDRFQAFWGFDFSPSDDIKSALGLNRIEQFLLTALEAGAWVAVGLLALLGLTSGRGLIRRAPALLVLGMVAGYQLAYLLGYAAGRWHEPVTGFVAVFAASGASWLLAERDPVPRLLLNQAFLALAVLFLAVQAIYAYAVATAL